jgi:hypothetical protein
MGSPIGDARPIEGRVMFVDQMTSAIVNARTLTRLDHLSKLSGRGSSPRP